jgi:two-component system chemotaxis sensor kinase CheA
MEEESHLLIELLKEEIEFLNSDQSTTVVKKKAAFEIFEEETEHEHEPDNINLPVEVVADNASVTKKGISVQNEKSLSHLKKEIKVSNEKLDALMDIMGELVIAESNVTQHPSVKKSKNGNFPQALNRLRKIVSDLQEVVLSTRMTPISGVFQRMSRLIRDLQKKSNKKISLFIQGEETQIDKSVVDLIADPIIHILRNSVDHGIESVEERRLAGKLEIGNIYLSARQSVNEVWIIIRDDGRGLNREKILNKGIEKGLFKGDSNALTDKEVFQMIFLPGLSTAKEITDISGRGVGMDIVKQNIEKLGGKIDIHSITGEGTTFILRIPLTLGIMEGTVVRIGSNFFTIQTMELKEFVGLRGKSPIKLEEGKEVYDIRGKFIPVLNMNQILKHRNPLKYDGKDQLMVVIEFEERLIGIKVDEVMGNHNVVIKPLQGQMEDATHVSGFTILGTGNVSLILDVRSIFQRFQGTSV